MGKSHNQGWKTSSAAPTSKLLTINRQPTTNNQQPTTIFKLDDLWDGIMG